MTKINYCRRGYCKEEHGIRKRKPQRETQQQHGLEDSIELALKHSEPAQLHNSSLINSEKCSIRPAKHHRSDSDRSDSLIGTPHLLKLKHYLLTQQLIFRGFLQFTCNWCLRQTDIYEEYFILSLNNRDI